MPHQYRYPYEFLRLDGRGTAHEWGVVWATSEQDAHLEARRRCGEMRGFKLQIGRPTQQRDEHGVYRDMAGWALRDAWGVPEQAAAYAAEQGRRTAAIGRAA